MAMVKWLNLSETLVSLYVNGVEIILIFITPRVIVWIKMKIHMCSPKHSQLSKTEAVVADISQDPCWTAGDLGMLSSRRGCLSRWLPIV